MNKTIFIRKSWFLLVALILTGILFSFCLPVKTLLNFYVDDGFFYLKTAKNFASGLGSTFDGINLTNGYHPLWFIILTWVFFITSLLVNNPMPELLLRVSALTHFTLICISYFFIYKSFKLLFAKQSLQKIMLFIALSLTPLAFRNFGIEIHITTLMLAVYVWVKSREIILKEDCSNLKIIVFCLIGLTRVDFFFSLVPVLILFDSYDKSLKLFFRNVLKYSVPVYAVAASYFMINYYYFGHIFSISSTIKSSFPVFNFVNNTELLIKYIYQSSFIISNFIAYLFVFILLGIMLYRKKKSKGTEFEKVLLHIFCGFLLFFLINYSFNLELFQEWYFAGPVFLSALTFTVTTSKRLWISYSITVIFFIISIGYIYNARIIHNKYSTFYDYAMELREKIPYDEVILQVDYSGIVGFLSDRKVVNGDGLINSFEYYDYYRSSNVSDYIKKYHIDYYSTCTALIDTTSNTVFEGFAPAWGGNRFVFPIENIKLRRLQYFDSFKYSSTTEWMLIRFN